MNADILLQLGRRHAAGEHVGITSVCSAHPLVIEATLRHGLATGRPVLIEATCNQVNQEGGYTGMTPADFRAFVERIAAKVGFDPDRILLGGDHLGPNPWKDKPAEEAMERARVMIDAYVRAGFTKIHLDTSMGCRGEPEALADETTAARAADLAVVAEAAASNSTNPMPVYVIGTEVPIPGGAHEAIDHLEVTRPQAAKDTIEVHRRAFAERGLDEAFKRVIAAVVQPGVEFGNENVVVYDPGAAKALSATLQDMPEFVFEAHSTDYQPEAALHALVADGFAILKVGPGLTFALREALYGLSAIACELDALAPEESLPAVMERLLVAEPDHWRKYYHGNETELRLQRHFSYSDRIRYYWTHPQAAAAVERLISVLEGRNIPAPLVSQYLGAMQGDTLENMTPRALLLAAVTRSLDIYHRACTISSASPVSQRR